MHLLLNTINIWTDNVTISRGRLRHSSDSFVFIENLSYFYGYPVSKINDTEQMISSKVVNPKLGQICYL